MSSRRLSRVRKQQAQQSRQAQQARLQQLIAAGFTNVEQWRHFHNATQLSLLAFLQRAATELQLCHHRVRGCFGETLGCGLGDDGVAVLSKCLADDCRLLRLT